MIFQPNTLQVQGGGTWSYEDNENDDEFCAVVLLADGSFAHIEHLSVHELTKMLGLMTCLSGCNKGAIKYMLTKSRDWWDMMQVGKLSQQCIWFILVKHFWLRVLYGLRTVSTSYNKLLECLMKVYCQIHLQLGIWSLARRGICQLDFGFYGVGCPHPAIECLIAQLNKLLVHYGNQSCLGIKMQITLELLVIELGMSPWPFQEEYKAYLHWVTHLWVKLVRGKASCFKVDIKIADLPVHPPWERDSWLMQEFVRLNYNSNNLWRLNCVC